MMSMPSSLKRMSCAQLMAMSPLFSPEEENEYTDTDTFLWMDSCAVPTFAAALSAHHYAALNRLAVTAHTHTHTLSPSLSLPVCVSECV